MILHLAITYGAVLYTTVSFSDGELNSPRASYLYSGFIRYQKRRPLLLPQIRANSYLQSGAAHSLICNVLFGDTVTVTRSKYVFVVSHLLRLIIGCD